MKRLHLTKETFRILSDPGELRALQGAADLEKCPLPSQRTRACPSENRCSFQSKCGITRCLA